MRIALINEGTYPVATGGVSTWCHQLVTAMPEHDWTVVTLTGVEGTPIAWELPPTVTSVAMHALWGAPRPAPSESRLGTAGRRRRVKRAAAQFWSAVLPPADQPGSHHSDGSARHDVDRIREAFGALVDAGEGRLGTFLVEDGSAKALLAAWRRHAPGMDQPGDLTVGCAVDAAMLVDRTLAATDVRFGDVDLTHASSNGASALVALARKHRDGTPFLLTEHGVYLRERYLALAGTELSWQARYVVTTALRALCTLAYRDADMLLPVSEFNGRWSVRLGADPDRIHVVHNGVDTSALTPIETEPEVPTISFVGRIDPLKDLATLVRAYALVREELPAARLRIFGPCPTGNEEYKTMVEGIVEELGVADGVSWEGRCDGPRPAFVAGHVVALSSVSEGLPFTTIEAMMCGRATVNTDVGGVVEIVGTDGQVGALVRPRDHESFARECLTLLVDDDHRRLVGRRARAHVVDRFSLDTCIDTFRRCYLHGEAAFDVAPRRIHVAADTRPTVGVRS